MIKRKRHTALANDKGQVNLGNFYADKYFDLQHKDDGTVVLTPVKLLKPGELPPELQAELEKK